MTTDDEKLRRGRAWQRHQFNSAKLQRIAKWLSKELAPGTHFALVVFDSDIKGLEVQISADHLERKISGAGYSGYVSNADRDAMIKALRECADVLEAKKDFAPADPAVREAVDGPSTKTH